MITQTQYSNTPSLQHSTAALAAGCKALVRRGVLTSLVPFRPLLHPVAGAFGILMYHRITPHVPGVPAPTWNVTPRGFRRQLAGLLKRGFRALPLREVLRHYREGKSVPPKTFVVTFDDGYANNYWHAWPILQELQIPATIFLATAYLDSQRPFPFDDWTSAGTAAVPREAWQPLSTRQCVEMQHSGFIELGAHTHTHGDFRNRPAALTEDLQRCLSVLQERFGLCEVTFAFPYGTRELGFSGPVLSEASRQAGVLCSLSTESELIMPQSDPFEWGRFTAEGTDTAATLAVKLSGGFEVVRRLRRLFRSRSRLNGTGQEHSEG